MRLRHVCHTERLQLAPAYRLLDDGARMIGVHMDEQGALIVHDGDEAAILL